MLVLVALVVIALGGVSAFFARAIQRVGVARMGRPRNRLAALSLEIARSNTALRGIRMTGGMCLVAGGALLVLALRAR